MPTKKHIRPSWDEYFMGLVDAVAKRGTCDRGRAGCVIVRDKQVLVTGYVGSAKGLPHCDDAGHLIRKLIGDDGSISEHCTRTVHAEQNALCQAARTGVALDGATAYCLFTPCLVCAKMLINSGIKRVVCHSVYQKAQETAELFQQVGVDLEHLTDKPPLYE